MRQKNYNLYFYLFAALHFILWILLPLILRNNPHLDTLEAIIWGQEWQFGYSKHPPLSAWFAESVVILLGKHPYICYLLSQICVALSFVAIWRLAKLFLLPPQSLMAVMLLEGVYYYNFTSVEYNTNVLMLALWAWSIFYCWRACNSNKSRHWIKLGILLALAIIDKYYAAILVVTIFVTIIYEDDFRKHLKTFKPYLAPLSFIAILTPHLIWLVKNNYSTFSYISSRASSDYHFYNHLLFPLSFLLTQLLSNLGALIIFFASFWQQLQRPKNIFNDKKSLFLIFMMVGPIILTILPSLLFGSKMKDMWGTSLWGLSGISLFYFFKPQINKRLIARFIKIFIAIAGLMILIYLASILLTKFDKRDSFNGKLAALEVNKEWLKYNDRPLKIVAGDIWLASNISFFSNQNISVFIDFDDKISPWISYSQVEESGGIILWDIKEDGPKLPNRYKNKIRSNIIITNPLSIKRSAEKYQKHGAFELGVGIIMPKNKENIHDQDYAK